MRGNAESHDAGLLGAILRLLACGFHDGKLRSWPAPPHADSVNLLCDKLSADMTHHQWNEWVSPNIGYTS